MNNKLKNPANPAAEPQLFAAWADWIRARADYEYKPTLPWAELLLKRATDLWDAEYSASLKKINDCTITRLWAGFDSPEDCAADAADTAAGFGVRDAQRCVIARGGHVDPKKHTALFANISA